MDHPMMKCGCAAQGVRTATGGEKHDPPLAFCLIHDCIEVADVAPDLTQRIARCTYRSCKTYLAKYRDTHYGELREDGRSYAPSSLKLPFFRHKPDEQYDEYFCGCMGWD